LPTGHKQRYDALIAKEGAVIAKTAYREWLAR
jgi:hypothetical protein